LFWWLCVVSKFDSLPIHILYAKTMAILLPGFIYGVFTVTDYSKSNILFTVMIGLFIGYLSSLLWMSVLCFDIYWTFRHFWTSTDDNQRFKFYFFYSSVFVLLTILLSDPGNFSYFFRYSFMEYVVFLIILFLAIFVLSWLLLILAIMKIFQLSKASNSSEQSRFSVEKDRFWTYVELFAILSVTFPMEMILSVGTKSHKSLIVADIIMCFSSFLVFAILVLRKNVRVLLMEEYDRFRGVINRSAVDIDFEIKALRSEKPLNK